MMSCNGNHSNVIFIRALYELFALGFISKLKTIMANNTTHGQLGVKRSNSFGFQTHVV